jgi:hypothetical protein
MCSFFSRRIDSGSSSSNGLLSFGRGLYNFDFNYFTGSEVLLKTTSPYIYIILNYVSGKHSEGDGAHAHTTMWNISQYLSLTGSVQFANIPENNYYLVSFPGVYENINMGNETFFRSTRFTTEFEVNSGEGIGDGWESINNAQRLRKLTSTWSPQWCAGTKKIFNQYPNDPDDLMDIQGTRRVKYTSLLSDAVAINLILNYNAITFTLSGQLTGFTGSGAGITVDFHRADTGQLIATTTSAIGGSYSVVWYDNTINVFAEARQTSTNLGRSDNGVAT